MPNSAFAVLKKIIETQTVPQHKRISALNTLGPDAPAALLRRIIQDERNPGRLIAQAGEMLLVKMAESQIEKDSNDEET